MPMPAWLHGIVSSTLLMQRGVCHKEAHARYENEQKDLKDDSASNEESVTIVANEGQSCA